MPLGGLIQQQAFDDETTRRLGEAFDSAWTKIVASRSPLAEESNADRARLILAKWLIARIKQGEPNQGRLLEDAIGYMASLRFPLRR